MNNSGSSSIVEQLSQGPSFSYNTFICDSFLALTYPMPYALFLASCSMGSAMFLLLFLDLVFPYYFQSLRIPPGFQCLSVSLLAEILPIELWDSLSGYAHPGIACLAFWASDWLGAF